MKLIIPMLGITPHGGNRVLIDIANYLADKKNINVVILSSTKNMTTFDISKKVSIKVIFGSLKNKYIRILCFLLCAPFFCKRSLILSNHFLTFFPSQIAEKFLSSKNLFFVQGVEGECLIGYPWIISFLMRKLNILSFKVGRLVPANTFLAQKVSVYGDVFHCFNLGVSKRFFLPQDNKTEKKYDVVYFARPEVNKGIDRFFEILDKNRTLSFLCISQDDNLIKILSDKNITCFKPTSDLELFRLIDMCKVLLLTSYNEGFALPPLEGMFRLVPLVYFDCGGPKVYTTSDNSVLIDSSSDFCLAFNTIMENYSAYQDGCLKTARKFILEDSLESFGNVIIDFLETK